MTTKTQVQELIDKLADKTLSFGCKVILSSSKRMRIGNEKIIDNCVAGEHQGNITCILGHDILIGDVYEAMRGIEYYNFQPGNGSAYYLTENVRLYREARGKLTLLWEYLGLDTPLQEIVEKSGWEYEGEALVLPCGGLRAKENFKPILKDPASRKLLNYLIELGL